MIVRVTVPRWERAGVVVPVTQNTTCVFAMLHHGLLRLLLVRSHSIFASPHRISFCLAAVKVSGKW